MLRSLLKIKPEYVFILIALFFEWRFNKITPPLQAPDEFNHFYRALQISEGQLLPLKQNNRLGGDVPVSVQRFVRPYTTVAINIKYTLWPDHLKEVDTIKYSAGNSVFYDYPNTAIYSPVSYAPQAFIMWILKKFDCTVATLYYGGRYMIFICWLIGMMFVIRMIPYGKWLMTVLLLLPMNLYITNSFSADTVTNIIALLFIAYVLKLSQSEKQIVVKHLLFLFGMIIILAFAKVVYIGLVLLLFVIPPKQFKNKMWYAVSLSSLFLVAFVITYYWSNLILSYYMPYLQYNPEFRNGICLSNCANYYIQKQLILDHKWYFLNVIYSSIAQHPITYLNGYIGIFGNSDIFLSKTITNWSYFIIAIVAVGENNEKATSFLWKPIFVIAAFVSFVFLLLSQHLTWDCVGEGIVDLVQGRYLIPLFPLLFLLLSNTFPKNKWLAPLVVILTVFVLHHYACVSIYNRFYKDTSSEKIEFYCDAEKVDDKKLFITSNDSVKLEAGKNQCDTFAHNGKFSAALDNWIRYGMTYRFKNLRPGDLIEMSGWQKGTTGLMVLSAGGKDCNFFYGNKDIIRREKNGWGYMNSVLTLTKKCDSTDVIFFVWNPDTTKMVYFDDVRLTIKRFNENYLEAQPLNQ